MPRELVLVGGGHAHVQVIRRFAMRPLAGVRLTVVLDRPEAVYSGMVPGFVAGDYAAPELEIDVRAAGEARRRARGPRRRARHRSEDEADHARRPAARSPTTSRASTSARPCAGSSCPASASTRSPRGRSSRFVERLEAALAAARERRAGAPLRVVVVGGGAAGDRARVHARGAARARDVSQPPSRCWPTRRSCCPAPRGGSRAPRRARPRGAASGCGSACASSASRPNA